MSKMQNDDVKFPEYISDGLTPGGRPQKVPFLYRRDGETWEEFCARMGRVSRSLNNEPEGRISILDMIMAGVLGALWCLLIWVLVQ